jgi:uncharacterized protein YbaP (TraB family)
MSKKLNFFFPIFTIAMLAIPLAAQKPATKADETGLLWEISGNGLKQPSYIFGTFHILCPADMLPVATFSPYFDKVDQVIMEIDMDDPAEVGAMTSGAMLSGGKTIKDALTPEQYAKVDEMIKNAVGVSVENVKMFKPAILGVLVITSPKMFGCSPPSSYERSFVALAADKKKPIMGLETVEFQSKVLETSPLEKQAAALYEMSKDPQKAEDQLKQLIAAYKTQDIEKVHDLAMEQAKSDPEVQKDLLDDRNATWIPKLESNIKAKPSFIAVGAGHLGGKNGVLQLLRAKGYMLRPIRL